MPYSSNDDLPASITAVVQSTSGQSLMRQVINAQLEAGKSESVAFASGWAALENAGYVQNESGRWVRKILQLFVKESRAMAWIEETLAGDTDECVKWPFAAMTGGRNNYPSLGVGVSEHGRRAHRVMCTLAHGEPKDDEQVVRHLCNNTKCMNPKHLTWGTKEENEADKLNKVDHAAEILKVDDERRIVWGWASVSTVKGELVVDTDDNTITPEEMEKMADEFMLSVRTAKAMHTGDSIGEVIHSLPLTKELGSSLGISSDTEGWIIAMKIHDDKIWDRVKSGELGAFSIGGMAVEGTDAEAA